jgi:hypothetical protein
MKSITEALRQKIRTNQRVSEEEEDEDKLFEREYIRLKYSGRPPPEKDIVLPLTNVILPSEDNPLAQKLREEARAEFLQRRSRALLDNEELKTLWGLLDSHADDTTDPLQPDAEQVRDERNAKFAHPTRSLDR